MSREQEERHLGKAEAEIIAGDLRVTEQIARIEQLRADGHETVEAERFLTTLETTLAEWRAHRDQIVQALADMDAGLRSA